MRLTSSFRLLLNYNYICDVLIGTLISILRFSNKDSVARTAQKLQRLDRLKEDMNIVNAAPEDPFDHAKWRKLCKKADTAEERD